MVSYHVSCTLQYTLQQIFYTTTVILIQCYYSTVVVRTVCSRNTGRKFLVIQVTAYRYTVVEYCVSRTGYWYYMYSLPVPGMVDMMVAWMVDMMVDMMVDLPAHETERNPRCAREPVSDSHVPVVAELKLRERE